MNFREQLKEDIELIKQKWGNIHPFVKKDDYAFNFWILSRLYDIEEEVVNSLITEYKDSSIDCYVHYEDSKELYIIQNKFYGPDVALSRKEVSDFLITPLQTLLNGKYSKSKDLQKIFTTIKSDPEYKIYMHFFVTNNNRNLPSDSAIKSFNNSSGVIIEPILKASFYTLDDISTLYYGESFKNDIKFNFTLRTINRGTTLKILPKEYDMPGMSEAYYIMTPVQLIYKMFIESKEKKYPLFEENIREYLGKTSQINRGILNTLNNTTERKKFFYYNNGITISCKGFESPTSNSVGMIQPQVINGCQTVSSIYEVLSNYSDQDISLEFKGVFVMVKVLKVEEDKANFHKDVVKYTNKQNSINEKAFGAKKAFFSKIQQGLKARGFLLLVKPSDRNTFISEYSINDRAIPLLNEAKKFGDKAGIEIETIQDLFIPLDKLLQVYISCVKDGYFAYTKKDTLLKEKSENYSDYSLNINKYLSIENIIRLWLIYVKAENDRYSSADKRSPIPFYLIGFLGFFIKDKSKIGDALEYVYSQDRVFFELLYKYLSQLTNQYKKNYTAGDLDYNIMIKRPINDELLIKQIDTVNDFYPQPDLKKFFASIK